MSLQEIPIRLGQYAPGRLVSPRAEAIPWTPENQDSLGNQVASLTCSQAIEVRFQRPPGSPSFQIIIRGALTEGIGKEWTLIVPSDRMGILYLPEGFRVEQSMMGAVYKLWEPRDLLILAEKQAGMPGVNFSAQFVPA